MEMTKLQELSLTESATVVTGQVIRTARGWRRLTPQDCHYRYSQTEMLPWDIKYDRDKDPRFNPSLRTNSIATPEKEDGRYRDGFVVKDGVEWTHSMWAFRQELRKEHIEETAARINRRGGGEDFMKNAPPERTGRFDKWGVRIMT